MTSDGIADSFEIQRKTSTNELLQTRKLSSVYGMGTAHA